MAEMKRQIHSRRLFYHNSKNQKIAAMVDYMDKLGSKPFVVIVPGYAETKRDYISTSYYLVANGFNVLRYDHTNHLGESDGEIVDTTPGSVIDDLISSINFLQNKYDSSEVTVVASSVAARFALRVAAQDKRVRLLVSLVGVVDIQRTLFSLYREDLVSKYLAGERWISLDIFGHEVRGVFIEHLINQRLHNLEGALDDIRKITRPLIFINAEQDVWVDLGDIRKAVDAAPNRSSELQILSSGLHRLQENPYTAKRAILAVVRACRRPYSRTVSSKSMLFNPAIHDIAFENKLELASSRRRIKINRSGEIEFWSRYLTKFSVIMRSPDYQNLLASLQKVIGGFQTGDCILDAGCGNGHLGVWLIRDLIANQSSSSQHNSKIYRRYVGLDFTEAALLQAASKHQELLKFFNDSGNEENQFTKFDYVLGDLERELPFQKESFNKICCSLVISYVTDPVTIVRRLVGCLKNQGRIVISSLKPYCDLSVIYRNYADLVEGNQELLEARDLLSSAGQIRKKESEGHYQFFSEIELIDLMKAVGIKKIGMLRTLGNQANVAFGVKD